MTLLILRTKAEHVKVVKSSQSTRPRRTYARGTPPGKASLIPAAPNTAELPQTPEPMIFRSTRPKA
jgi:hypothetical protein